MAAQAMVNLTLAGCVSSSRGRLSGRGDPGTRSALLMDCFASLAMTAKMSKHLTAGIRQAWHRMIPWRDLGRPRRDMNRRQRIIAGRSQGCSVWMHFSRVLHLMFRERVH